MGLYFYCALVVWFIGGFYFGFIGKDAYFKRSSIKGQPVKIDDKFYVITMETINDKEGSICEGQ